MKITRKWLVEQRAACAGLKKFDRRWPEGEASVEEVATWCKDLHRQEWLDWLEVVAVKDGRDKLAAKIRKLKKEEQK